ARCILPAIREDSTRGSRSSYEEKDRPHDRSPAWPRAGIVEVTRRDDPGNGQAGDHQAGATDHETAGNGRWRAAVSGRTSLAEAAPESLDSRIRHRCRH